MPGPPQCRPPAQKEKNEDMRELGRSTDGASFGDTIYSSKLARTPLDNGACE